MKIALLGYGKMGKEIEKIAIHRGNEICCKINTPEDWETYSEQFKQADAAIDFSVPKAAINNIYKCFEANVPVVVGTTGWTDKLFEVKQYCLDHGQSMMFASNFSIGVNIFFEISKRLATLMNNYPDYNVAMEEIHHTQKLDSPSGTAITLAEGILSQLKRKQKWVNENSAQLNELPIVSKRIEQVPGTHIIEYDSSVDSIQITHTAKNRQGFATGAVLAAEWIVGKKGYYEMKDFLNI